MRHLNLRLVLVSFFLTSGLASTAFSQEPAAQPVAGEEVDKTPVAPADQKPAETASETDESGSAQSTTEKPFIDRNGDGINDCMQHRFRKGGPGRGKAGSGKARGLMHGAGESSGPGEMQGSGMPKEGAGTGPDGNGNGTNGQGRQR